MSEETKPTPQVTADPKAIDLDNYADMSVGQILRKTREHYGQSLTEVEANLNIRASQLDALEKLKLDKLPGRVYAIGFVRSYSEYLGLDGDKMVRLFKAQSVGKKVKPSLSFPVTYTENNTPNVLLILIALVGVVLFISYMSMFHAPAQTKEAIPPVPEVLKKSNEALLVPPEPKQPVEVVETKDTPAMELVVTQDSWVEIKNARRKKILSQVLKPGDRYIVPDEEGLTLTTGNAGGVEVYLKGKKVGTIGRAAQVKCNVKLVPESFELPQE